MTLTACSSRIGSRDPDCLDITRKGNHPQGVIFAPSETILRPALRARDEANKLRCDADDLTIAPTGIERLSLLSQAEHIERDMWFWYEPAYTEEMRASYKANRSAWLAELKRERRVYCCFCPVDKTRPIEDQHCHRIVFRGIIAKVGAFHGVQVIDGGEL